MDDSFGAGGFNANATQNGDQPTEKKEGVLPVVIKQLLLMDEITLFGLAFSTVNTVAIIRGIDYSATKITYRLEDHTGQIDAFFWLEEENTKQPNISANRYARVIGSLRNGDAGKNLIIYHIEEIPAMNELTTHLLEVLYVRYKAEALSKQGAGGSTSEYTGLALPKVDNSTPMETDENLYGLSPKCQMLYQAIKAAAAGCVDGVPRSVLEQKFPKLQKSEIEQMLESMSTDGVIYTTIDSDHYLPCDG